MTDLPQEGGEERLNHWNKTRVPINPNSISWEFILFPLLPSPIQVNSCSKFRKYWVLHPEKSWVQATIVSHFTFAKACQLFVPDRS